MATEIAPNLRRWSRGSDPRLLRLTLDRLPGPRIWGATPRDPRLVHISRLGSPTVMCSCFFVTLISAPKGSGWLATFSGRCRSPAKQQSRRRSPTPDGFAFVPHTVPLWHRWVVEPAASRHYKKGRSVRPRKNSRSYVGSPILIFVAGHAPHKETALMLRIDDLKFFDCCFQR
jgi:hypothetical protein